MSLVREQAKETATIKEEFFALRSEMNEIRQNSKFLTESVDSSSSSSTPVNATKKIPAELSVSCSTVDDFPNTIILQAAVKLLHESAESTLQFTGAEPYALVAVFNAFFSATGVQVQHRGSQCVKHYLVSTLSEQYADKFPPKRICRKSEPEYK